MFFWKKKKIAKFIQQFSPLNGNDITRIDMYVQMEQANFPDAVVHCNMPLLNLQTEL